MKLSRVKRLIIAVCNVFKKNAKTATLLILISLFRFKEFYIAF